MVLKESSKSLGVTTEHTRLIERDTMPKIKIPSKNNRLKDIMKTLFIVVNQIVKRRK